MRVLSTPSISALGALLVFATTAQAAEKVRLNHDVRPILSGNCFYCHGPDEKKREAHRRPAGRERAAGARAFARLGRADAAAEKQKAAAHRGADRDAAAKDRMHRLSVTSATYRQTSQARPDLAEKDPRNLLLARQERVRVAAEIVRDAALSASGLLDETIGGPSVHPPPALRHAAPGAHRGE